MSNTPMVGFYMTIEVMFSDSDNRYVKLFSLVVH